MILLLNKNCTINYFKLNYSSFVTGLLSGDKHMNEDKKTTMQEVQEEMECLKKVFSTVRLLDEHNFEEIEKYDITDEHINEGCCDECFAFWKKDHPCENCISLKALKSKSQKTKLEYLDKELYQVTSRYLEIDNKPYVMELVKHLDDDTLIDSVGRGKMLERLAAYENELYTDALTGAYNRRYYEEQLKKSKVTAGIAMLDLDDFKLYNDTCGHDAGDAVLDTFVSIIKNCIRKSDALIRYGGDEFLLVMPGINKENFTKKLQLIREQIHDAVVPQYSGLRLSTSIGGVLTNDEIVENAIVRADRLMYKAKNLKNAVVIEGDRMGDELINNSHVSSSKLKQQILIVDDSDMNREMLAEMLKNDFKILEAANGEECLTMLTQYGTGISVILLDIMMPVMDGFEVLDVMNRNHWIEDIPVIMISTANSDDSIRKAYELGVSDYISRPFDAKVVYQRVSNMIKLYAKQRRLVSMVTDQIYEKEKNGRMMVSILSQIVEFRNGESGSHVRHINLLTGMLLERLVQKTDKYSLSWSDRYLITTASSLHDIGKIGIDEKILNKPGRLTNEEFEVMKTHTLIGASMLKSMDYYQDEKLIKIAYEICRWHHERYDGKGYPDRLEGEKIPISAQVVSIVDVYDALVSKRVYKEAYSHEKAIQMIQDGECGAFNPILLECLLDIQDKIKNEIGGSNDN